MYKILSFITFIFCSISLVGQSEYKAPRLTKTTISNTGCFAYLPDNKIEKKYDLSYSPDSSKVYTGDFEDGEYHFAIILVKMNEPSLQRLRLCELLCSLLALPIISIFLNVFSSRQPINSINHYCFVL